jgi:hypothetical protein
MPDNFGGLIVAGLVVGTIAAACAFVVSYGSYQNQFMDTRTPRRLALQTAGATFVFFFLACVALPWVFGLFRGLGS